MIKLLKAILLIFLLVITVWFAITVWAEAKGPKKEWHLGPMGSKSALVVYDPDPFYNLDEQVCRSLGLALCDSGMNVTIVSVSAAEGLKSFNYDLFVFCSNTYNWRPDWAISGFIPKIQIKNKPVVAITLGAGSTTASQQRLDSIILQNGGKLLVSRSFWLMRPNDKSRMKESNVKVAVSMAYSLGQEILKLLGNENPEVRLNEPRNSL